MYTDSSTVGVNHHCLHVGISSNAECVKTQKIHGSSTQCTDVNITFFLLKLPVSRKSQFLLVLILHSEVCPRKGLLLYCLLFAKILLETKFQRGR